MIETEIKRNKKVKWDLNFYDSIERIPLNISKLGSRVDNISSFDNYDEKGNLIKFRYDVENKEIFEISFTSVQRDSLLSNDEDFEKKIVFSSSEICTLLINEEIGNRRFTEKTIYFKSKKSILIFFGDANLKETLFYKASEKLYFGLSKGKLQAILLKELSSENIEDFFY